MTDSEVEIEPYEEVIGDLNYSTPPRSKSAGAAVNRKRPIVLHSTDPYNLQEKIYAPTPRGPTWVI